MPLVAYGDPVRIAIFLSLPIYVVIAIIFFLNPKYKKLWIISVSLFISLQVADAISVRVENARYNEELLRSEYKKNESNRLERPAPIKKNECLSLNNLNIVNDYLEIYGERKGKRNISITYSWSDKSNPELNVDFRTTGGLNTVSIARKGHVLYFLYQKDNQVGIGYESKAPLTNLIRSEAQEHFCMVAKYVKEIMEENKQYIEEWRSENSPLTYIPVGDGDGAGELYLKTIIYNGLEWQHSGYGNSHTWKNAVKFCNNLTLGGRSDWRLPTKDELKGLVKCTNGKSTPLADWDGYKKGEESQKYKLATCCTNYPLCDNFDKPTIDNQFSCQSHPYWTSSIDKKGDVWGVNFYDGRAINRYFREIAINTRCVRSIADK